MNLLPYRNFTDEQLVEAASVKYDTTDLEIELALRLRALLDKQEKPKEIPTVEVVTE